MDRASAIKRVQKLRALADPTRGGTPAEREVAIQKATVLVERFGLEAAEIRPQPGPSQPVRVWTARPGDVLIWDWGFDPATGEATDNVEVHYHHSVGDWSITIYDDRIGQEPVSGNKPKSMRGRKPWSLPKQESE